MGIRGPSGGVEVTAPFGDVYSCFDCCLTVKKWFTDVETVRTMFGTAARPQVVRNEEQILSGSEENYLNYPGIRIGSELVKSKKSSLPPDPLTVTSYLWQELSKTGLVQQSAKVFDSDEEYKLTEGVDFEIDYERGRLLLIKQEGESGSAGSSTAGVNGFITEFYAVLNVQKILLVHYDYYSQYTAGTDYTVNYEKGKIARLLTGDIATGTKVYIDYETTSNVDDELIELTIDMAHTYILEKAGDEYEGSADLNLKYGESYLAMAQAVAMAASIIINRSRSDGNKINQITKNLQALEESYEKRAETFLAPYLDAGLICGGTIGQNIA